MDHHFGIPKVKYEYKINEARWISAVIFILLSICCFRHGIAAISPFTHRLAFDKLPEDIQQLRCKVNYEALDFVPHVKSFGDTLVRRLRYPFGTYLDVNDDYRHVTTDEPEATGKFVALHLRFDKVRSTYPLIYQSSSNYACSDFHTCKLPNGVCILC